MTPWSSDEAILSVRSSCKKTTLQHASGLTPEEQETHRAGRGNTEPQWSPSKLLHVDSEMQVVLATDQEQGSDEKKCLYGKAMDQDRG